MSLNAGKNMPIGIFDSGMGGLTVLRALKQRLPNEHFLYLGDTARLPYGTKSVETVRQYALNANEHLVQKGMKALVVACNTASSVALSALKEAYADLPIIGVIEPGVQAALKAAKGSGPIVVLATEGTVKSQAYSQTLRQIQPNRQIIEWPCPLLVALAEEGWHDGALVQEILKTLLAPLYESFSEKPAGFLLGCTHFPVFKNTLQSVVGLDIPVIDPAEEVGLSLEGVLRAENQLNNCDHTGTCRYLATDGIDRFVRVAPQFLGHGVALEDIELVTVGHFGLRDQTVDLAQSNWDKPLNR